MIRATTPITAFVVRVDPYMLPMDIAEAIFKIPIANNAMPNNTTKVTTTAVGKNSARIPTATRLCPELFLWLDMHLKILPLKIDS